MARKRPKKPTLREEANLFHAAMHRLSIADTACNNILARDIIGLMVDWSYAHRVGNGELSDREQEDVVRKAFWRLHSFLNGNP